VADLEKLLARFLTPAIRHESLKILQYSPLAGENLASLELSTVYAKIDTMLIPRFSTLGLLGLVTAGAFVALTVRFAYLGHYWAVAIVICLGFLVAVFAVHSFVFFCTWLWSLVYRTLRPAAMPQSPFATSGPPKQIVRPDDLVG
jgi:hypothetical protein